MILKLIHMFNLYNSAQTTDTFQYETLFGDSVDLKRIQQQKTNANFWLHITFCTLRKCEKIKMTAVVKRFNCNVREEEKVLSYNFKTKIIVRKLNT